MWTWTPAIATWLLAAAFLAYHWWLPRYRPGWAARLAWRRRRDLDREIHVAPALAADARPADDRGYRDTPPDIDADRLPWPASWTRGAGTNRLVREGRSAAIRPGSRGDLWGDVRLVRIDRKGAADRVRLQVREMAWGQAPLLGVYAVQVLSTWGDGMISWFLAALGVVAFPLLWWEHRRKRAARDRDVRAALDEIEAVLAEAAPTRVRAPEVRATREAEAEQEPATVMSSPAAPPSRTEGGQ